MSILFITNPNGPDYMSDMIFHGGKSLMGHNFYESNRVWYMYDDVNNKQNLYGRGFTMYGKLKTNLYSDLPGKINDLIEDKFFDKIIYGSIWRCDDYFDLVSKIYNKKNIIFIDGEDHNKIKTNFKEKGKYFKRELYDNETNIYPINFCVPEELIVTKISEKTKLISDIIPNSNHQYSYNDEKEYYREYGRSWFAITQKKMGWDCLRHYEIMMNGCIPSFLHLEECPKNTMTLLPKKEMILFAKEKKQNIDDNQFILDYTKINLTTKKIVEKLLQ